MTGNIVNVLVVPCWTSYYGQCSGLGGLVWPAAGPRAGCGMTENSCPVGLYGTEVNPGRMTVHTTQITPGKLRNAPLQNSDICVNGRAVG